MATKVLQQVAAILYRLIHIKARHRAGRAGSQIPRTSQYHGRTVIDLRQSGSHNTDHTLMPRLIIDDDRSALVQSLQSIHDAVGLFGHALIEVFAGFVVLIDLSSLLKGRRKIFLCEQVNRLLTVLDATRCIDARANLEDDIPYGNLLICQSTYVNDSLQPHTGVAVNLLQAMEGQNAILAHDGHNV